MNTGLWIRIQHRFGPRMMEWWYACHTFLWGTVLLFSSDSFTQPQWIFFKGLFGSEVFLGWIMIALGFMRLAGLIVNGARKDVTPLIRQWSAAGGCLIWVGVSYCFWQSGVISTWIAIYPLFAIGELVNLYRAGRDEGEIRVGKVAG